MRNLEKSATAALLLSTAGTARLVSVPLSHHARESLVEDILETLPGKGGALEVLKGTQVLHHGVRLIFADGRLALLLEALKCVLVGAQIGLGANDEHGHVGAVVLDLFSCQHKRLP